MSVTSSNMDLSLVWVCTGQRNRKRALAPKAEDSPLGDAASSEGRKSEPEAALAMPTGLEAVTPPPQRRKSMAGAKMSGMIGQPRSTKREARAVHCLSTRVWLPWMYAYACLN